MRSAWHHAHWQGPDMTGRTTLIAGDPQAPKGRQAEGSLPGWKPNEELAAPKMEGGGATALAAA